MLSVYLVGLLLVAIGIILSFQTVYEKIKLNAGIGWLIAAAGMLLLSLCEFISGSLIYAIITLIFAIVNIYICVNDFKK